MINFFRKIRKKLADDDKPIKYMRYAVGEIALLMIGILLALQVNNWNEERKNFNRESILLNELILNLTSNIESFKYSIIQQKRFIHSIDYILDHLEQNKPYNDSLPIHFRRILFIEQMTLSKSAYETFKSLGFELIRSDVLRMEIIQLFEVTYPNISNFFKDVAMQRYGVTRSMFNKYLRTNRKMEAIPMDYLDLQQNQEFINWVYNRRAWKSSVIGHNQDLIEPTDLLIKSVNNYLGK
jgi:hypothetical protein